MDALIASMMASGPEAKRPPHMRLLALFSLIVFNRALKEIEMLETKSKLPTLRLVAFAAVAGILVGTTALYVMGALDGNQSSQDVVTRVASSCPAYASKVASIDPFITGDVAA